MEIDWKGVKRDYERGKDADALARKYGCSAETVRKRARKEGWRRKKEEGRSAGRLNEKPRIDCAFDEHGGIVEGHRVLWKEIKARLVSGLSQGDPKAGLEELKAAKVAGEVLLGVIKGERQAWGLDEGGPEKTEDDAEGLISEIESLTVPSGADEAVDGE